MKRILFVSIGLVLLAGCGSKLGTGGALSGKITYNGKPINGAVVFFHPISGEGKDFDVTTTQEGTFTATNLPPGEYKVYVEPSRMPAGAVKGPEVPKGMDASKAAEMQKKFQQMRGGEAPTISFPKKYHKAETSDLKCTITQGKKQPLNLELKD